MKAGNTVDTLQSVDRDEAVRIDASPDQEIPAETVAAPIIVLDADDSSDPLDDENTFDVSRAEFNEFRDAFLRLYKRVEAFNRGAPHKI